MPAALDGSPTAPAATEVSLEEITHTETTVVVSSSSPPDAEAPSEREDEIDEDRAYFAPRIVPKAAIPVETDAAKVVINLPADAEEITQAMDKGAFDQRVRDDRAALARRREPTVRIPRKDVQAVRNEIAAAERAGGASSDLASEIPVYFEAPSSPVAASSSRVAERGHRENVDRSVELEASAPRNGSSEVGVVVAFLVAAVAAAGGAALYFTQRSTASGVVETNASAQLANSSVTSAKEPTVQSSAPRAIETASPALELSGAPAASTDPSVVTLNAAAAQGSSRPGSHPTTAPSVTGAHPLPSTGPKPISNPYQPPVHLPTSKPPAGKPGYPTEI